MTNPYKGLDDEKEPDAFDFWWADEHGTGKLEIEDGTDTTENDDYSEQDQE